MTPFVNGMPARIATFRDNSPASFAMLSDPIIEVPRKEGQGGLRSALASLVSPL